MGLLSRKERSVLVGLLLKLPNKEKFTVRTNLLSYIPTNIKDNIERDGAPRVDFENILVRVDDENWDVPPESGWPLLTLLENAIDHVGEASSLASQMKTLYGTVSERASSWAMLPRVTDPKSYEGLERQIQEIGGFLDSRMLHRVEHAVCRVEIKGRTPQAIGTGFLLGKSIAITNFHVLQEVIAGKVSPELVVLRFDCVGNSSNPTLGQEYKLAKNWLVANSPIHQLDYVLMRVQGKPGSDPVSTEVNATMRGYLNPVSHDFLIGEPLVIVQHPKGLPRRFSVDRVKRIPSNGMPIAYVADTDYGSSGSPCFTSSFELVALHKGFFSSTEDSTQPNKGIPFTKILENSKVRDVLGD